MEYNTIDDHTSSFIAHPTEPKQVSLVNDCAPMLDCEPLSRICIDLYMDNNRYWCPEYHDCLDKKKVSANGWYPETPLMCPSGYVISRVNSAVFGRPAGPITNHICQGKGGPTDYRGNVNCYMKDVSLHIEMNCIGLEACLPSMYEPNRPADPCPNTIK